MPKGTVISQFILLLIQCPLPIASLFIIDSYCLRKQWAPANNRNNEDVT